MGVDVVRRMSAMSSALEADRIPTGRAASLAAVKVHRLAIQRDAGGDSRLSGVGKRGAKVGARFDQEAGRFVIQATGPLVLIERNTKAHRIPKQRGARARKRYAVIPGVGVRAYANHPGTRGKHTWERSVPKAQREAVDTITQRSNAVVRKAFKG